MPATAGNLHRAPSHHTLCTPHLLSKLLKLGVVDQSPVRNGGTAADAVRETLELARITERLGYWRYWLAEHHSTNSFAGAAPEVLIPQVAAATRTMRVGSGGVMLSHYSPLKVAEQFRMLATLFPGRIDLGIGRAPGGDWRTSQALAYGRGVLGPEAFPQQVEDLIGLAGRLAGRRAPLPARARDAALGRGPGALAPRLRRVQRRVRRAARVRLLLRAVHQRDGWIGDGERLPRELPPLRPARRAPGERRHRGGLRGDAGRRRSGSPSAFSSGEAAIARGQDRGIPSPEQAEAEFAEAGIPLESFPDDPRVIAGDPDTVREKLLELAQRYGVEELMLVTVTHSFQARVRSYELIAEAMGMGGGGVGERVNG